MPPPSPRDQVGTSSGRLARPKMRDVAALARVSVKTASRVISGQAKVDAELAARVSWAVSQLNYKPNLAASSLRRADGRSGIIGLLLEDMANPFSTSLYQAVEDVASRQGLAVLTGSLDEDPEPERC